MKRILSSRLVAGVVLAGTVLGTALVAQAHTDVQLSIGLPLPVLVPAVPAPVYVRPEPVYVQPRPVYVAPSALVYDRDWRPDYHDRFEREREWRHHEWQRREWDRREWDHRHDAWDRYQAPDRYGR
jgi:hypothetical protein